MNPWTAIGWIILAVLITCMIAVLFGESPTAWLRK